METASALNNINEAMPQKTLDFRQAMHDFKVMFPTLDVAAIECVLRSNAGHVDATIDQLLQLSQSRGTRSTQQRQNNSRSRGERSHRRRQLSLEQYESTDSEDSIPIELLDPPTSSDDDFRDPPPMYTPTVGDTFSFDTSPVEAPRREKMPFPSGDYTPPTSAKKLQYKAWNPPLLGKLPDDFLRILPQQFVDASSSNKKQNTKKQKPTRRHSAGCQPQTSHSASHLPDNRLQPPIPYPRPPKPVKEHILTNARANSIEQSPPIPPRDPNIVPGDLFIRNSSSSSLPSNHRDFKLSKSSSRSSVKSKNTHSLHSNGTHSVHSNGARQHSASVRKHNSSGTRTRYPQRRHSDLSSRRMVMVQPNTNNMQSSRTGSTNSSNHQRTQQRSLVEEEQYIEDHKLALLLQNEEFLKELQRNEDFLRSLEKDNAQLQRGQQRLPENDVDSFNKSSHSPDGFVVSPDPELKYPVGPKRHTIVQKEGIKNLSENDREFKENMKHMGKSTKKKFNEIARKFSVKRPKNYKSMMNTVDPVFANCEEYNASNDK